MKWWSSIQSRVTLLVLGFGLAALVVTAMRNDAWLRERRWRRAVAEADDRGTLLAGMMQHYFRNKMNRAAELQMSYAATADELDQGVVVDERSVIVLSTRLDWVGMRLGDVPLAGESERVERVRSSMNSEVVRDDGRRAVVAVHPFFPRFDPGVRALVLLRYDVTQVLDSARSEALRESAGHACVLLALCVLLWLVLDFAVTQRVRSVVAYAQAVAEERPEPPVLTGEDDLAMVSREFAGVVKKVRETDVRLLEDRESERRRIGADLHDDVCQRVVAAQLKSGVLEATLARESHPQSGLAKSVAGDLEKAAGIVRGFARGLAPMLVERGRLAETVYDMAETLGETFMVRCDCECDLGGKDLAVWADTHVYRITQELAVNAAKHARPTWIRISVKIEDERLSIDVENDGKAFEPGRARASMGLEMIRQRVRALGGRLEYLRRADRTGCLARCEVRLEARHFVDEKPRAEA